MEIAASWSSVTAASLQNSPANTTNGRFRRLRAKAQAANSIAVKENPFFFYGWIILSRYTGIQERGDEDRNKQGI